jgi:hypothetical protein
MGVWLIRVVGDDAHLERFQARCDHRANLAETDEAIVRPGDRLA